MSTSVIDPGLTMVEERNSPWMTAVRAALPSLMAVIAAFSMFGLFILIKGVNPFTAYHDMFTATLTEPTALGDIAIRATPIVLAALAVQQCLDGQRLHGVGQHFVDLLHLRDAAHRRDGSIDGIGGLAQANRRRQRRQDRCEWRSIPGLDREGVEQLDRPGDALPWTLAPHRPIARRRRAIVDVGHPGGLGGGQVGQLPDRISVEHHAAARQIDLIDVPAGLILADAAPIDEVPDAAERVVDGLIKRSAHDYPVLTIFASA